MPDLNQRIKEIPGVLWLWSIFRARQQERKIRSEQEYYESQARDNHIDVLDQKEVQAALRVKLSGRGLHVNHMPKGELRILYVSELTNWEPHQIPPALSAHGDLLIYKPADRGFHSRNDDWETRRELFERDLYEFVRAEHAVKPIDVMVSYLSGYHVSPKTITDINNLGVITCAFCWDDRLGFRGGSVGGRWTGPADLVSAYDINMTNASQSLVKYFAQGGLAIFWPEGADPDHFRPLERPFEYDVSFIGACYGQRPAFINYLRRDGINVETFGPGWPNGPVSEDDMIEVYARSRINLGMSGIGHSMKETCLKGRDFEVPMSGALYLTSDQVDLHRVYKVGKEVIAYKNKEDCLTKIRYLLDHEAESNEIRAAARQRSLEDHTWERRFEELFMLMGLVDE